MRSLSSSYRISSCHFLTSPSWAEEGDASFPHFPGRRMFPSVVWEAGQQRKKWKVVNGTPPASGGNRVRGLLHPFQLDTMTQGMYSFPSLEPVCNSMSSSNCCFLTCIQISQEAGQMIWYSHFLKNFPVCCDPHSQRLWHSQWSRCRCFSGTLLLFPWSSGC